jgi:asparagine synthase (glutamine-hydrolysing)
MCGILFSNDPSVRPEHFHAALGLMHHRGPDAQGHVVHGGVQLGHTRLSIVDLNPRSNQPFYSRDGRHVIVFNGEVYNFRELAREHGIALRTSGDTELLLELYLRHGERMLGWLHGMFAFVVLDTLTGEFFAARDRLGVKPLYVHEGPGGIILASEVAAVLHLRPDCTPDDLALRQYRRLRGFFNGRTAYREVAMFPAGHWRRGRRTVRYWDLPTGERPPPSDAELDDLVRTAVSCRCLADVPVGSYLSGGLDSSIVAALSNRTHTWVTGLADDNEFDWSRQVAAKLGTRHHEVTVTPGEFIETAARMIRERREPLAVPNEVLLHLMTRAVKRENTVVLSGEGADELFAGYDRIFRWAGGAGAWDSAAFTRHYAYGSAEDPEVIEDALAPFLGRGSPYAVVSAFFQVAHLHGLLRRLDHATMLCGVEGRVPFVDHRLVERLAGVPLAWKMAGGEVKAPLKRVFGRLLPAGVVTRPKVGFPVPLGRLLPPGLPGATDWDRWFNFNLIELGLPVPEPLCA